MWHYREADEDLGPWQALELTAVLETRFATSLYRSPPARALSRYASRGSTRGRAYAFVKERRGPYDFTLVTGDDRTDEDVFERLDPGNYSVRVGVGGSAALTRRGLARCDAQTFCGPLPRRAGQRGQSKPDRFARIRNELSSASP